MTQLTFFDPEYHFRDVRKVDHNGTTVYSLVDLCSAIAGSKAGAQYWRDTKKRLAKDGFETQENLLSLKITAADGKKRATDFADVKTCLRIVQSIPSPNAEPVRQWLAQIAHERLEEAANPELGMQRASDRARKSLERLGRGSEWNDARVNGMWTRSQFTARLAEVSPGINFAEATNTEYRGLLGKTAAQLRASMGLAKRENVRNHLPVSVLHLLGFIEATVTELFEGRDYVPEHECLHQIDRIARYARQLRELTAGAS